MRRETNVHATSMNATGSPAKTFSYLIALVMLLVISASSAPAHAALSAVSPGTNAATGFPEWYRDANGLTLAQCLVQDGKCILPPEFDPAITNPLVTIGAVGPGTFPDESFYSYAQAIFKGIPAGPNLPTGGNAFVLMNLEAAFASGAPAQNDQMTFMRVWIRIDAPVSGTYTVTYPYGTKTYDVTTPGIDAIRDVVNIGCAPTPLSPCDFKEALLGEGPFLTWDAGAPPGYIGDPAVLHTITGSPFNTNYFRVDGPVGSNLDGAGNNFFQENLFTVAGKIFTPQAGAIGVTGFTPASPVRTFAGEPMTFSATFGQAADVNWYLNGNLVQTDLGVAASSYTATGTLAMVGINNVRASANGVTDVTWSWAVRSPVKKLQASGPVNAANGFPEWYQDANGLALEPCLAGPNGLYDAMCILPTIPPLEPNYDPALPIVFPTNFPTEFFYWIIDSDALKVGPTGGDQAKLRIALEGAFATADGTPAIGQQMTFLRINLPGIGKLTPNSVYTVTHPFGTFTITTDELGDTTRSPLANMAYRAEDGCGAMPCDFTELIYAPTTNVTPLLTQAGMPPGGLAINPANPDARYIGDGITWTAIAPGPNGAVFRIDGPGIGGAGINTIQTDLWTVAGRIFPGSSITGYKINDLNGNGIIEAGEQGIAGWNISALNTDTGLVLNATTDANGFYTFNQIVPGNYTLTEEIRAGWMNTTPAAINILLQKGIDSINNNFTNRMIPVLTSITVTPATASLVAGTTQAFTAQPLDQFGAPIVATVTWATSDPLVGTIDAAGLFTAMAPGTAAVTATSGTISGSTTVTVTDTTAPVITILGNNPETIIVGLVYIDAGATATDNVDPVVTVTSVSTVDTAVIGTYTVTYTATDAAGNAATATRIVNVVAAPDLTPPVLSLPADITAEASSAIGAVVKYTVTANDAVDGPITPACTPASGSTFALGTTPVICSATDAAQNTATGTFNVIVQDTTSPMITVLGTNPVDIVQGSVYTDAGATATDIVDGAIVVIPVSTVDTAIVGIYTVAYTATDAAGNTATATRTVNVVAADTTPPVITLLGTNPMDVIQSAIYTEPGYTAIDNIDGDITASVVVSGTVDTNVLGTYTLTYSVSDAIGNTATATRIVNVVAAPDTIPPVITILGANPVDVLQGSVYTDAGATATDNVDPVVTVNTASTVNTAVIGTYTVTYTAADAAGNIATATRTVNVIAIPPVVPVLTTLEVKPATASVATGVSVQLSVSALDQNGNIFTPSPVITWTSSDNGVATVTNQGKVKGISVGTITITAIGGGISGTSTITVINRDANQVLTTVLVSPANPTIPIGKNQQFKATGLDQNGIVLKTKPIFTWSSSNPAVGTISANGVFSAASVGTTVVTVSSGTVQSSTIVTVKENTGYPVVDSIQINEPDLTLEPGTDQQFSATPLDNDGNVYYDPAVPEPVINWTTSDPAVGTITADGLFTALAPGTTNITASTLDDKGLAVTATIMVTVLAPLSLDTIPPVITMNGANPMNLNVGDAFTDPGATAYDNIDGDITANIQVTNNVNTAVAETYSVVYTVSDATGNPATETRTVNVNEIPPQPQVNRVHVDPDIVALYIGDTQQFTAEARDIDNNVIPGLPIAWSMKNNDATVGNIDSNGLFMAIAPGNATIVATIGNVNGTADIIVNLPDTTPPVITILGANPVDIVQGSVYTDAGATALDDVDGAVIVQTSGTVDTELIGTYTITYAATDAAGNIATATRTVNVVAAPDTTAPVITIIGQNPIYVVQSSVYTDAGATAVDNVDPVVTVNVANTVNTAVIGTYTVTYTATDAAGNTATATRTVNVVAPDNDDDGVPDNDDFIEGTCSDITSNFACNLKVSDHEGNVSVNPGSHSGPGHVEFEDETNQTLVEFEYEFSTSTKMDLSKIKIIEDETNGTGSIVVSGLNLSGSTKTVYVTNKKNTAAVCIKDAEVQNISEISSGCNAPDETTVKCDGSVQNGYACTPAGNKYKITGLKHSAVMEYALAATAPAQPPTSEGGYMPGYLSGSSTEKAVTPPPAPAMQPKQEPEPIIPSPPKQPAETIIPPAEATPTEPASAPTAPTGQFLGITSMGWAGIIAIGIIAAIAAYRYKKK